MKKLSRACSKEVKHRSKHGSSKTEIEQILNKMIRYIMLRTLSFLSVNPFTGNHIYQHQLPVGGQLK